MYSSEFKKSANCELKDSIVTLMSIHDNSLFDRILKISNDYTKLIRVTSFIFRFIHNSIFSKVRKTGPLTYSEVSNAEHWIIKSLQRAEFSEEIKRLEKGESNLPKSKLASLNVFLDENKMLRVGGRLTHSDLQFDSKFPIILPSKHPLTNIILRYFHLKYFHLGSQALSYHVRQRFWPLNGINNCRKIVNDCVTCFKNKPVSSNQIMGNLPTERVKPTYAFNVTGIDFCGPFYIKFKNQRKGVFNKIYVAVYVCFCSKAIHLDFVTDLTSEAFYSKSKTFLW
ncbi:hypothetical protein AVEN_270043-1 [Araneus ventricosus]|uniref:Integrase zinc-binding domain-containing protein n=1 Tax=Araneus ventricosus TaxID=182803 RepID=A0A4Y2XAH0_ARAVE|nr:hypothetical protein AVEN_270043-1 [Araneus ventricosus]